MNLSPAVIERSKYILKVLDHLSDTSTYQQLSIEEVEEYIMSAHRAINNWQETYDLYLTKAENKYLKRNKDLNLPYFYMTTKVHKNLWSMHPITSCKYSILSHLGVLVD